MLWVTARKAFLLCYRSSPSMKTHESLVPTVLRAAVTQTHTHWHTICVCASVRQRLQTENKKKHIMIIGQLHPTSAEAAKSTQASTPHYIVKGWRGRRSREEEGNYRQQWCQQSFGCTQGSCGETLVCAIKCVFMLRVRCCTCGEEGKIHTHSEALSCLCA